LCSLRWREGRGRLVRGYLGGWRRRTMVHRCRPYFDMLGFWFLLVCSRFGKSRWGKRSKVIGLTRNIPILTRRKNNRRNSISRRKNQLNRSSYPEQSRNARHFRDPIRICSEHFTACAFQKTVDLLHNAQNGNKMKN
jgi:hypothetical protein